MLHLRKRGQIWHVRGTVRVGERLVRIQGRSTGCRERAAAEEVAAALERDARDELLHGAAGRARRLTVADALALYLERDAPLGPLDIWRIGELNEIIGERSLADHAEAWARFRERRCKGLKPATIDRFRAVLQAALNHAAPRFDLPRIRIAAAGASPIRLRWLGPAEQERLLAAYRGTAADVALMLCFQGLRTSEALRLDWRHVDWARDAIHIADTKSGVPRTVPLHPRVATMLGRRCWDRGGPERGPVFLTHRGAAYRDTREKGGSPFKTAHRSACARAGIEDFRPHDWRHHWASHMVMTGCDLRTLQLLGGWSSLRMVERYAAVSIDHMAEAIRRLA